MAKRIKGDNAPFFVGSAGELRALAAWLDDFERAAICRVTSEYAEPGFVLDLRALNKVLANDPDYFGGLNRYGGLRCPSERLALTWDDVDFVNHRIVVQSPKTAKREGRASRVIPLFPELQSYLEDARELSDKQSPYVVTRYRDGNANLRTTFEKIVRRAGLAPWPRIFHNLRASRATELAAEHPAHIAAAWLGHSTVVAQKHYWQVTDADFERAVAGPEKSGAKSGAAGTRRESRGIARLVANA